MRRLATIPAVLLALCLAACDGDPAQRTLTLQVRGDSSAPVGEELTLTADLSMDHDDSLQEVSRLAIYLPEGPSLSDVVSGPTIMTSGLSGELIAVQVERTDGVPETLIDFQPPVIPLGPQTLQVVATYRCEADGAATIYVDATFRGDEPIDTVSREEMVTVTCGAGPSTDGGTDAGGAEADAGVDAGAAPDGGGADDGGPSGDGGPGDAG